MTAVDVYLASSVSWGSPHRDRPEEYPGGFVPASSRSWPVSCRRCRPGWIRNPREAQRNTIKIGDLVFPPGDYRPWRVWISIGARLRSSSSATHGPASKRFGRRSED